MKSPLKYSFFMVFLLPLTMLTISCCNCTNDEQSFSLADLEWIPADSTGDSVVFIHTSGAVKTFFVRRKEQYLSEVKCAGPCFCNCPEDNSGYFDFELTGAEIQNTLGIHEGLTINLIKTNNHVQHTFSWSCLYGSFYQFDYTLDTLTVSGKLYEEVYVKELEVCHIRKIFYCKKEGLIRFDYDDGTWQRVD